MIGQVPEEQQIGDFFKPKPFFPDEAAHDFVNIHPAVEKLSLAGDHFAVHNGIRPDLGNFRKTRQHTLAVDVAQAALNLVFGIKFGINGAVFFAKLRQSLDFRRYFGKSVFCHSIHSFTRTLHRCETAIGNT